mgnify:CR=1 FL=1
MRCMCPTENSANLIVIGDDEQAIYTWNISDEVIRYLLVKIDHKARAALAEAKKRAAEREAENSED